MLKIYNLIYLLITFFFSFLALDLYYEIEIINNKIFYQLWYDRDDYKIVKKIENNNLKNRNNKCLVIKYYLYIQNYYLFYLHSKSKTNLLVDILLSI